MHRPAMRASPQLLARIKRIKQRRQIIDDAFQLHFNAMHESIAFQAVPLKTIDYTLGPRALNDEAAGFWLGALRGVA